MKVLKRIVIILIASAGIGFVSSLIAFRFPASTEPDFFEGNVLYKFVEITGSYRQLFEELIMQNRTIRLVDDSIWYVSKSDYAKLWPENPHKMSKKNYTIKAKVKVQKLFFGGYSRAEVAEYEILNETPVIKK